MSNIYIFTNFVDEIDSVWCVDTFNEAITYHKENKIDKLLSVTYNNEYEAIIQYKTGYYRIVCYRLSEGMLEKTTLL